MEVVRDLQRQADAIARNDLGRAEAMLIAPAHTLDAARSSQNSAAHGAFSHEYKAFQAWLAELDP